MKDRAPPDDDKAQPLDDTHSAGLRQVSWALLVESFAKIRAFRNWHLEQNEIGNESVLSNKNNVLP
ncbi:hypothetical protein GRI39_10835 [Altererythrobacter indicus]|uniref:Uncharacterized protein n=1 Tax=Altericroceibacterium indicum TaxID=374177 RepID=A0A845ACP2_9SPHN|nr:hypothetical protein [Altericroceibacterium indicum]MXP26535.1 hypothetical protein [Altericroceibacterium indicum]